MLSCGYTGPVRMRQRECAETGTEILETTFPVDQLTLLEILTRLIAKSLDLANVIDQ